MIKKVVGQLFPRTRYMGGSTAKVYFPKNRPESLKLLGGASKVYVHVRVYDRSSTGAPVLDFDGAAGCFSGENPFEGLRSFTISAASATPTLPWNSTNMPTVPDDGTFTMTPTMGLLDVSAKVSGSAACWIEFEIWFTAEYA